MSQRQDNEQVEGASANGITSGGRPTTRPGERVLVSGLMSIILSLCSLGCAGEHVLSNGDVQDLSGIDLPTDHLLDGADGYTTDGSITDGGIAHDAVGDSSTPEANSRCNILTPDGIPLNPGCDPCVKAGGVSAVGGVTVSGKPYWQVHCGKRYWEFDFTKNAFVWGSSDVATAFRTVEPKLCSVTTTGGIPLNPGCDPCVKAGGVSAVGGIMVAGKPYWQVHCGKKYWEFDFTKNAFVWGSSDVAAAYRTVVPTSCAVTTTGGIPLNPGCDPCVKAGGVSAVGGVTVAGKPYWQVHCGKKYWEFDFTKNAFVWGSPDVAAAYRTVVPTSCAVTTTDGIPLNPGCDPCVKAGGVSAVGGVMVAGKPYWQVHCGKKIWEFDFTKKAFVWGAKDVATAYMAVKP